MASNSDTTKEQSLSNITDLSDVQTLTHTNRSIQQNIRESLRKASRELVLLAIRRAIDSLDLKEREVIKFSYDIGCLVGCSTCHKSTHQITALPSLEVRTRTLNTL
jgi:predicted nucleic acid-binding protein